MTLLMNTPIWVWGILIFLLVIGIRQLKSRRIKLFQPLIAPAIFLPLLLMSILKTPYPLLGAAALAIGIVVGIALGGLRFRYSPLLTQDSNSDAYWQQRGSTIPLSTYLYIFITRYLASALPHFPMPSIPDYAADIIIGLTGVGIGVLLAIVLFRNKKNISISIID